MWLYPKSMKEILLNRNFKRVNQEVEDMVKELLGIS